MAMIRTLMVSIAVLFASQQSYGQAPSIEELVEGFPNSYLAQFAEVGPTSFRLEAIAREIDVREYAICKAIWYAEKLQATNLSLSNPAYREPGRVTTCWIIVTATAYLNGAPNPDDNPTVDVRDYAQKCRQAWDWYR